MGLLYLFNVVGRGQLKCDGTRAQTRILLSAKRTSPFKSAGESVQSTTGSRSLRISGSNAGYTMFGGNVKSTGYPYLRHHVPSHFNWSLRKLLSYINEETCKIIV